MGKFEKLKIYNLIVFAFVPLLIVAMVATITLAAMTVSQDGKNVIEISGMGELSCDVTATDLYPDSTRDITMTFTYAGDKNTTANSANSVNINFNTFKFTSVKAISASNSSGYNVTLNNTNAHNKPAYFTSYTLLNGSTDVTSSTVTVTKGTPVKIILRAVLKPGYTGDASTANPTLTPSNYLTNSITSLQMAFSVNVTTA